jgi:L-malate glycosyltransferase
MDAGVSPRRMRILVLSSGGVGHTQRWVDYFVDQGDEVHLATLETGVPTRALEHRLPSLAPVPALKYPMAVPWLRRLARELRPDVVAAHYVPNYGLMGALLGRRPLAVVAWGSDVLLNAGRTAFHRWRARYVLERADLVFSDAQMLTRTIAAQGIRPRRVETLTFGVDTRRFRPLEGSASAPPIILSYRQLLPLYHVDLLVRAVPEIKRRTKAAFQVRIIGQGSERERLVALAHALEVAAEVTFVPGRPSDEEMIDEIRRASVYVSTSTSDTTSVSLLEAMACGVPPVVTRIPGSEEWIVHGENGFLVPLEPPAALADAIVKLLEQPTLGRTFAERNLGLVRSRADWTRNMARTRELLAELAEGRS